MERDFYIKGDREGAPDYVPFPEPIAPAGTPKRREQDIRMMKAPQHWPSTRLCMKRYDLQRGTAWFGFWDGAVLLVENDSIIFNTPEQLVDAGWTVD